jgi:hypothetical protein
MFHSSKVLKKNIKLLEGTFSKKSCYQFKYLNLVITEVLTMTASEPMKNIQIEAKTCYVTGIVIVDI